MNASVNVKVYAIEAVAVVAHPVTDPVCENILPHVDGLMYRNSGLVTKSGQEALAD